MNKRRRDERRDRKRRRRGFAQTSFARPMAEALNKRLIERVEAARDARHSVEITAARGGGPDMPIAEVAPCVAAVPDMPRASEPIAVPAPPKMPVIVQPAPVVQRIPDRIALLPGRGHPAVPQLPVVKVLPELAPAVPDNSATAKPCAPPTAIEISNAPAVRSERESGALRRAFQVLYLPVVLAAAVVMLSNHFAPTFRPGTHLTPAPVRPVDLSADSTKDAPGLAAIAPLPAETAITEVAGAPQLATSDARDGAIAARETDFLPRTRACTVGDSAAAKATAESMPEAAFGLALARAAEAQARDFVIYKDEYYNIRYPGGDIPALYGVCSDVVIRAYRQLGIDLQRLVHEARVGSGDSSIDHRRTETLRRFFARHAARLPVSDFAEDYLPGDIVTYERPQNRGAQAHIAIVSSEIGASGRPMIVHNRGWGPQIEDALFVDHMTGHYRLSAQPRLLTSWGKGQNVGQGMESWATLVRRAAIQRGAAPVSKEPAKKKGAMPSGGAAN